MSKLRMVPRVRRAWRALDALWAEIEPLLPSRTPYRRGATTRASMTARRAMDAIFVRLTVTGSGH